MGIDPTRPSFASCSPHLPLLQYLHGLENHRQHDDQGLHDHLGEIQHELRDLADYIREKEVLTVIPPVRFKDHSAGGSSIISLPKPRT